MKPPIKDTTDLLEALMRQVVSQCIDIERLAYLEECLIEAMTVDERDRDRVAHQVQDQIDRTWQELMFEFERIRSADCSSCAVLEQPALALPFLRPS
jgi:hypothetical protein